MSDQQLKPDEMLTAEFEYIAQAAFQANEDRARVTTLYLLTLGSLVAAILTSQFVNSTGQAIYQVFAALFFVLSAVSVVVLLQLVRLRVAWFDSVSSMNRIKKYYIDHCRLEDFEGAFRWRELPRMAKPDSVSFLLALEVALLGGVTCGAALICLGLVSNDWWWERAIPAGLLFCIGQLVFYWLLLWHEEKRFLEEDAKQRVGSHVGRDGSAQGAGGDDSDQGLAQA